MTTLTQCKLWKDDYYDESCFSILPYFPIDQYIMVYCAAQGGSLKNKHAQPFKSV